MPMHPTARRLTIIALCTLLPVLPLVLGGCGESDTIIVPDNPFDGIDYGQDDTIEIVTWNVETFAKKDQTTVDYMVQAIEAMDVDIIAMQEIEDSVYFRKLYEALPGWSGFKASSAAYDIDLAFLWRNDGRLGDVTIHEILTDEDALPRAPLVLECTFDGVPLVVIDNHYKAVGDGIIDESNPYDEETRRRDGNLLLEDYCNAVYPDEKVVILGDMNDELTDPPSGNVFANFLDDPDHWRFVDLPIAQNPDTLWSYPSWPSHIDHILINEHLLAEADAASAEVMVLPLHEAMGDFSKYNANISDHLPVMFRFDPIANGSTTTGNNPFAGALLGGEDTLEIVTWNIQNFPKAGAATVSYAAQAIAAMGADLVALQEIEDATAFENLLDGLDALGGWSGLRAGSYYSSSYLAYVYRTDGGLSIGSTYEILGGEQAVTRPSFVLECSWNGTPLVIIDNHYKCCGDGTIDQTDEWDEEWRRLRTSRLLQDWVETNKPNSRVIILGDLNDELTDPAADNVFQDFLDDAAGWRFLDLSIAQDEDALWSYPGWPSHLDHLLVTSELFTATSAAGAATRVVPLYQYLSSWSVYDGMITDHLPVAVVFEP